VRVQRELASLHSLRKLTARAATALLRNVHNPWIGFVRFITRRICMFRCAIRAAALALATLSVDPAGAQRVRAGILTCDISAGIGFIIGSQKSVSCAFASEAPGSQHNVYSGSISKFGLDIGATRGGVMVWAVFTDSIAPPGPGFLAGDYLGATGQVTVAAGLGANVLIGGSNRTVALQLLSVDTSVGLNLAVGVAELHLRPGP
jgi:hypothetical protein